MSLAPGPPRQGGASTMSGIAATSVPESLSSGRDLSPSRPATGSPSAAGLRASARDWALRGGFWVASAAFRWRGYLLAAAHVLVFALTYLLAYAVRFDGAIPAAEWRAALATVPLVIAVKLIAFLSTRSHRGWWRYNGFDD